MIANRHESNIHLTKNERRLPRLCFFFFLIQQVILSQFETKKTNESNKSNRIQTLCALKFKARRSNSFMSLATLEEEKKKRK